VKSIGGSIIREGFRLRTYLIRIRASDIFGAVGQRSTGSDFSLLRLILHSTLTYANGEGEDLLLGVAVWPVEPATVLPSSAAWSVSDSSILAQPEARRIDSGRSMMQGVGDVVR
jgi:hypothetical protein